VRIARLLALLAALLLGGGALAQSPVRELRLLAAELPPYTFQMPPGSVTEAPGPGQGLIYEVVAETAKRVGHSGLIEFLPWAEAQRIAMSEPNVGILALTRSPEREERYRWLAKVVSDDLILVGSPGIDVSALDKAKDRPIGVLARSGAEALLRERDFTRIRPQSEEWINARLIQQRRIDAWLAPRLMVIYAMLETGGALEALNFGEIVRRSDLYLAASKDLPDVEARKWAQAFEAVKQDGTYARIADRYSRMKVEPIANELRRRFAEPVWDW
jgi:polar amino acid transport system substrate-binding protein